MMYPVYRIRPIKVYMLLDVTWGVEVKRSFWGGWVSVKNKQTSSHDAVSLLQEEITKGVV